MVLIRLGSAWAIVAVAVAVNVAVNDHVAVNEQSCDLFIDLAMKSLALARGVACEVALQQGQ